MLQLNSSNLTSVTDTVDFLSTKFESLILKPCLTIELGPITYPSGVLSEMIFQRKAQT